jgi:hypothetical protein
MGLINNLAQERQWISGNHMHNLLPKSMFEELGYPTISPTMMTVQLVDSSIKYLEGIVENLSVNVRGSYVLADFVVLDTQEEIPLILG